MNAVVLMCGETLILLLPVYYLPKAKKFGCVGKGDLTSLFFSKVVKY